MVNRDGQSRMATLRRPQPMSISNAKLDQFVKMGGYDIVEQIKRGKRKGQWRHVSEASRRTKVSRPTIYAILAEYPEPPSKTQPKYFEVLEESEGYRRVTEMWSKKLGKHEWGNQKHTMRRAIKILGYNKDPMTWSEEDYLKLWNSEELHSDECKGIAKRFAVCLRRVMKSTNKHNLLAKFKFNNPPEGKKKQWFLHTNEIKALIQHIPNSETLMLTLLGITTGARHSGLMSIKVDKIDFNDNNIEVFERKVRDYVLKFPPLPVMRLLQVYVDDQNLGAGDSLFKHGYKWHLDVLKNAGKDAKVKKKVSTHILKHTYVSQAHRHGVSGSTISNQTGTELRCLVKFYRAEDENLLRKEMQGVEYNHKPFWEWAGELAARFVNRYNVIRAQEKKQQ